MRKLILTSLLLVLPASALAEGQVVVIKKDCYKKEAPPEIKHAPSRLSIFCKGAVKNIGDTDVRNVVIRFLTPRLSQAAIDKIDYLSAKDKEDFEVIWRYNLTTNLDAYMDAYTGAIESTTEIRITYQQVE